MAAALHTSLKGARRLLARRFSSDASAKPADLPSFTRGIFAGKIETSSLYPFPQVLTAEQQEILQSMVSPVSDFFANTNDAKLNDSTSNVPPEVTAALMEMGAFGLQVPEKYGGVGLSNTGYARMVEIVGGADLGVGIYLGAHQSIGFKGILLYGTEAQKQKYLPDLAAGKNIAAFALTEPHAGSDAAGIKTRAVLSADGSHYILNGGKCWISNGSIAEIFTVFAKTEMVDPKTGEKKDRMNAFVVERAFGGVTSGQPEKKMGIKCSNTAEVFFSDVKVPVANLLGEPGHGFKIAMGILNNGRFGMAAALTGTMKFLLAGTAEYAKSRKQFGKPIGDYGAIKGKIAAIAAKTYATESLAFLIAGNMDRGATDYHLEAAAAKVYASDAVNQCADDALQVHGGIGFMQALPYERIVRDARIFKIFEGENAVMSMFVAGTGLASLAKDLAPVLAASKAPLTNLGTLLPFALWYVKSRLGFYEVTPIPWAPAPLAHVARLLEKTVGAFGDACKRLIVSHGKRLQDEQLLLQRVAEAAIDLTAITASLARATRAIETKSPSADKEVALVELLYALAYPRLQYNLGAMSGGAFSFSAQQQELVADHVLAAGKHVSEHPLGF